MLAADATEHKTRVVQATVAAASRAPYRRDMEGPSIAAIVVPWDLDSAQDRVATALRALGMSPYTTPLPRGYKPTPGEFVGLVYHRLPPHPVGRTAHANTALVSTEVARIFHLAMTLSEHHPDVILSAWRRFSGFEPVAKVLWGGKPRWKDGEDHDHEIGFVLPREQPAEMRLPGEACVPLTSATLTPLLLACVKPVADACAAGGQAWLSRKSPLA